MCILDLVEAPLETARESSSAVTSTPWILGYIIIGVLIVLAVLIVIKLIVKAKKSKKNK
ncbi:MAG: hypothetical protein JXN65_03550 [Clostridia bacterium]|nr:hypothetical protein [Clostridia bacterium]